MLALNQKNSAMGIRFMGSRPKYCVPGIVALPHWSDKATSGDELKRRNGLGGLARDLRLITADYHRTTDAATLV